MEVKEVFLMIVILIFGLGIGLFLTNSAEKAAAPTYITYNINNSTAPINSTSPASPLLNRMSMFSMPRLANRH